MVPDAAAGLPMYSTDLPIPPVGVPRTEARWAETSTDTGNVSTFCITEGTGWIVHGEGKVSVYWGGEHRGYGKFGRRSAKSTTNRPAFSRAGPLGGVVIVDPPGLLPHEAL